MIHGPHDGLYALNAHTNSQTSTPTTNAQTNLQTGTPQTTQFTQHAFRIPRKLQQLRKMMSSSCGLLER